MEVIGAESTGNAVVAEEPGPEAFVGDAKVLKEQQEKEPEEEPELPSLAERTEALFDMTIGEVIREASSPQPLFPTMPESEDVEGKPDLKSGMEETTASPLPPTSTPTTTTTTTTTTTVVAGWWWWWWVTAAARRRRI